MVWAIVGSFPPEIADQIEASAPASSEQPLQRAVVAQVAEHVAPSSRVRSPSQIA